MDEDGLLRSCGRLQYAPTQLDLEKRPIILHAKDKIVRLYLEHAHQICIHQSTELTKEFIQQRYHMICLRKALASVRFHCFLCRRFDTKNIQDIFGPFYIEDSKGILEKHYGLIFTCMVTRAVHLERCLDINTETFLNAFRRFCSRRCQPQLLYSDNGETFVGASEEPMKTVKALDNDRIYKALAVANTTVFNLINRAKKMRTNNHQYTTEDIQLSRISPEIIQDSFFHSTVNSLQHGIELDSKCKI